MLPYLAMIDRDSTFNADQHVMQNVENQATSPEIVI